MACSAFVFSLSSVAASLQVQLLEAAIAASLLQFRNISSSAVPNLIRWEGPVFPAEPHCTLYVKDVDDFWNKILETNSNWVAEMPDPDETMKHFGARTCGADSGLATGNSDEVTSLPTQLRALNGHWTLGAKMCHRIGCRENTGLYWCNVISPCLHSALGRTTPGAFEFLPSPSSSMAPISGTCAATEATAVSIRATPCPASKPSLTATARLHTPASWRDMITAPIPQMSTL
ncbi:hypothetical protein MYCTH_92683 [Thermothelomyces thermophilus ATCC 42464]|uniref:SCP domain-containing protein n=1 Tax=Thermothelomyces thermophilus (strain ATCC 42464 / BCRC 31852 / DSM 1799) TaxID=573729 RepID=G2QAA0_THET4|nr:uncharacterized protein MYCTH_92683 [Thermothelomyces thermophilus ATCC 42464]AEO56650.1 hypothetical protein MYCTH_92683 [Thermothelomyces thermophilus ATCC 42464]